MKTMFTLLFSLLITIGYSQTKKEYWDPLTKTQLMAEYQVNSAGEKDGWFKGYNKQGTLIYEYNYQKNLFHGLNIEYATNSGKREISKSETITTEYYTAMLNIMGKVDCF